MRATSGSISSPAPGWSGWLRRAACRSTRGARCETGCPGVRDRAPVRGSPSRRRSRGRAGPRSAARRSRGRRSLRWLDPADASTSSSTPRRFAAADARRAVALGPHDPLERRLRLGPRLGPGRALVVARDAGVAAPEEDERPAEGEVVVEPEQVARGVEREQLVRGRHGRRRRVRGRLRVARAQGGVPGSDVGCEQCRDRGRAEADHCCRHEQRAAPHRAGSSLQRRRAHVTSLTASSARRTAPTTSSAERKAARRTTTLGPRRAAAHPRADRPATEQALEELFVLRRRVDPDHPQRDAGAHVREHRGGQRGTVVRCVAEVADQHDRAVRDPFAEQHVARAQEQRVRDARAAAQRRSPRRGGPTALRAGEEAQQASAARGRACPAGTSRRRRRRRRRARSAGGTLRGREACGRSAGSRTRCSRRGRARRPGSCPPGSSESSGRAAAREQEGRGQGAEQRRREADAQERRSRPRAVEGAHVGEGDRARRHAPATSRSTRSASSLRAGRRGRPVRPCEPARVVREPGLARSAELANEPLEREPAQLGVVPVRRRLADEPQRVLERRAAGGRRRDPGRCGPAAEREEEECARREHEHRRAGDESVAERAGADVVGDGRRRSVDAQVRGRSGAILVVEARGDGDRRPREPEPPRLAGDGPVAKRRARELRAPPGAGPARSRRRGIRVRSVKATVVAPPARRTSRVEVATR